MYIVQCISNLYKERWDDYKRDGTCQGVNIEWVMRPPPPPRCAFNCFLKFNKKKCRHQFDIYRYLTLHVQIFR